MQINFEKGKRLLIAYHNFGNWTYFWTQLFETTIFRAEQVVTKDLDLRVIKRDFIKSKLKQFVFIYEFLLFMLECGNFNGEIYRILIKRKRDNHQSSNILKIASQNAKRQQKMQLHQFYKRNTREPSGMAKISNCRNWKFITAFIQDFCINRKRC